MTPKPKKKPRTKTVTIDIDDLKILCLSVDYLIESDAKDIAAETSIRLQEKHKFDTHEYRLEIRKKGIKGT